MGSQNPDTRAVADGGRTAGGGVPAGAGVERLEPTCTRRALLAAAATAAAGGLAGCSRISSYTYAAEPVVLPADRRASLGLAEAARRSVTREHRRDVDGLPVEVTVTSRVAVYEAEGDGPWPGTDAGVGVVSTPAARLMGRTLNPLAEMALQDLLTDPRTEPVLRRSGLADGALEWRRGPTPLATDSTHPPPALLGTATPLRSFGAVVAGREGPGAAFLHAGRGTPADNVVVAAAVHRHDVDATAGPYVGPDGFVDRTTVDDARTAARRAVEALEMVG